MIKTSTDKYKTERVLELAHVSAAPYPAWPAGRHTEETEEAGEAAGDGDDGGHDQHQDAEHLSPGLPWPGLSHPCHGPSNILQVRNIPLRSDLGEW